MIALRRIVILLACLGAGAASAWAHAHLVRAQPNADAAIRAAPAEVRLWFTEPLESRLSEIQVLDAARRRVDRADPRLDADDAKVLSVALGALPPGAYRVVWKAVSRDGHVTHGDYGFTVVADGTVR
jgi:methionine-rich copper-binding protein CopC